MAVRYRFGSFELDPAGRRLLRDGEAVSLQPKAFDLLVYLVERHGELLSKDQLLEEVWSGTFVTENSLTRCAHLIRLVLEDDPDTPRYLETVPRTGYRFIAEVAGDPESVGQDAGSRRWRLVAVLLLPLAIVIALSWWWLQSPPQHSIAVLAFENMSGDPGQEYFSDGISDELLNVLAKIPGLTVISRSSAFSFKGKDVAIPEIAEQLNVAHVLEGSVRRDGNRVRIIAQLIEASSDSHLWSETYDRDFEDIFGVQEEIARAITDALKIKLALVGSEPVQPIVIKTASTDAYDAYLRGRELVRRRGRSNLEEAIHHLERSIRLDAGFAPAYAQLAIAKWFLPGYDAPRTEERRLTTVRHMELAEALDPDLAEVHYLRSMMANDTEAAIEHARRALIVNPSYTDAMSSLYVNLVRMGRHTESDVVISQQLLIDPLHIVARVNNAFRLGLLGQIAEAHQVAEQLLAQSPRFGYWAHAITYSFEGNLAETLRWHLRFLAEDPAPAAFLAARVFVLIGMPDEAQRLPGLPDSAIALIEGRFEDAIETTEVMPRIMPDKRRTMQVRASAYYLVGRISEALPLFEQLLEMEPEGRPLLHSNQLDISGPELTMRLALARRLDDDEDAAQSAAEIARKEHAARIDAGRQNQWLHRTEAMLAAFDGDWERVVPTLEAAMELGFEDPPVLDDPIFGDLRDQPRFIALRQRVDASLAEEREAVLQLVCFRNPVPDYWRPLPETCEGVVDRG